MTTPDFVLELRRHVGNAPLWMPGCTAIVTRPMPGTAATASDGPGPAQGAPSSPMGAGDEGAPAVEILCVRRTDNGAWTPVTGIVDPGEEPAAACEREVLEEAGVVSRARRVVSLEVVGPVTYDNGDVTTYLDTAFWLEWTSGEPYPADGENTEARFVPADRLPEMNARFTRVIALALSGEPEARFVASGR